VQPYQVFIGAGVAKIIGTIYCSHKIVWSYAAPWAETIGHHNAVALTMIPAGFALWALGGLIVEKRWHESTVGLLLIVAVSVAALYALHMWGLSRQAILLASMAALRPL